MSDPTKQPWEGAMSAIYRAKNILPDQISKAGYDNLMRHLYDAERHLRMLRPREDE